MQTQRSLIEIVNQKHGRPADGIPGDRASALGNPFDMGKDESLRNPVCEAYEEYFDRVLQGESPVPTAQQIAQARGLRLATAWKRPDRDAFMSELQALEQRQSAGKTSKLMCWCAPGRCHLETPKHYLDQQREQTQPKGVETEMLPIMLQQSLEQTEPLHDSATKGTSTDIAHSIQLLGQLSEPMLTALTARLETVKASLHEDVSNYARGRLNTWIGVQWDLKDKQFIPAGFFDEQLWELGQRLYPGSQLMLLTYSGDQDSTGRGIGLHRDDSYARFEARTLSVETREAASTWFMRQTYPGMTFEKQQNEQAGVHEFSLSSGSLITFNCKNQHAVEPGTGRWSLNLWQCSDKFQVAYKAFLESHGQTGGAIPHRPAGKDLILPKPIHVTETLRRQLSAPTVTRVMSVAAFNNRQPQVRPTARAVKQRTSTAVTAEESEQVAYTWSRYAPAGSAGYECSTQGDRRFSALSARLKDGRTVEEAYQLDVKGYRAQGNDWRLGKGKPPLQPMPVEALYSEYKGLWQQWSTENPALMDTLATEAKGKVLTDKFASTPLSQARALAELLNERQLTTAPVSQQSTATPDRITSLTANQVFVFGSNTEGRHGAGTARQAMQFGAEYGNLRGRQGQTYAIVTKDLTKPRDQQLRSVPLHDIEQQITVFLDHANGDSEHEFLVTRFGCALAGYSEAEIGSLWVGKTVPTNVRLPQAFLDVMQAAMLEPAIATEALTTEGVETVLPQPTTLVVVSGGQTGADFGGLKAGKALGLKTGGTAPYGWLVERCARFPGGTNPGLADYGLVEGPRGNSAGHTYILRTEMNVQNSDGTLVLGSIDPRLDKGSYRTVELAGKHHKPCLHISTTDLFRHPNESVVQIKDWVMDNSIQTLNVAGNRESKGSGLEDRVETVLKAALGEVVRLRTAIAMNQQTSNGNTTEPLSQVNQAIQALCSTETFRRAIDPTDFGTLDEMGVGKGGCLMVACALQDSLNVGEVCLVTSTDLQQPDDFPVFRHAVVRLEHPEGVHYLDGFGLHTEAAFQARWVTPDEQNDCKIDVEPLTPQSLALAVSNQGAYFHEGTVAVLTELCTAGLGTEALQLQSVFSTNTLTTQQETLTDTQTVQPVQYLFYTDHESCPQANSTDVYAKTELLTRKALQEAQKQGYSNAEFVVSTANDQPENVRATQALLHAVKSGVREETFMKAVADKPLVQATCRTTTTAGLDLEAMSDDSNHRLLLIGNGNSPGTAQIVQQAQTLGVKVVGYNPDTKAFLGSTAPKATPAVSKATKQRSNDGR